MTTPKPKRSDFPPGGGEIAYLAALGAWNRSRGRAAILGGPEDDGGLEFEDEGVGAGGPEDPPEPPPEGGPPPKDDDPEYETLRIPRIFGKLVRWVPISLPDSCPVTALGVQGGVSWFLNPHGELIGLKANEFGQSHIIGLFAPQLDFLLRAFPQFDQQKRWKGIQAQYALMALTTAAGNKGIFDAREKVRGLGCWKADDGRLVLHLGDRVLIEGAEHRPGEIGPYVYPGRPPIPGPKAGGKVDCETIYRDVQSWRWARGELDARLFLGWMACAVMGPSLDWRPMVFWLGDAGTGKSSLQDRLKAWLPGWLVSTIDASPAALRQIINQDGVGVAFDEIEADMLNDQAQQVMKLARVAASGGKVYRGQSDHKAAEFLLRGAFGFSAILPPSMRQQDMQRFAFLRLQKLEAKARMASYTPAQLRDMGAGVVGRVVEGWPRWKATLELYMAGLEAEGHAHRGAMQFGSLLAAADILLEDGLPDEARVARWCALLKRDGLYEYEQNEDTWLTAWRRLLAAQPEVWRQSGFPTVAQVVTQYLKAWRAEAKSKHPPLGENGEEVSGVGTAQIQQKLIKAGLAMVKDQRGRLWLCIPPRGEAMQRIFANTDMQAKGGEGVWTTALRGAPKFEFGEGVWKTDVVRPLQRVRCTMFRLDATVDIAGEKVPIFDETDEEEGGLQVIDAPYEAEREPGEEG